MTFPTSILSFFYGGSAGYRADQCDPRHCAVTLGLGTPEWCVTGGFLRQREFILAARLSGASQWRLFSDHLAGAVIPSLLVLASLDIGHMMLHVAGMSFLGLGVSAPTAEWG